ncbi:unnamed protein product [Brassica oleracea]
MANWNAIVLIMMVVVGTLCGNHRGHVYFAVQDDPTHLPAVLIQLPTPTSILVKEIASGLVRIALETAAFRTNSKKLLEEKECGEAEWRVLKAVGPITMGAYYDGCQSLSCGGKGGGKRE